MTDVRGERTVTPTPTSGGHAAPPLRQRRRLGLRAAEVALAVGVLVALAWEVLVWSGPFAAGQGAASAWWYVPPALAMAAALLAAHRLDQHSRRANGTGGIRPGAVAALAVVLALGMLGVHQVLGGPVDQDVDLFARYGRTLLGTGGLPVDPPAEYPPLALLAFAAAAALADVVGPLTFAVAWPLLTLPLLVLTWWLLARTGSDDPGAPRTGRRRRAPPSGPWMVAVFALWPTLLVFWR